MKRFILFLLFVCITSFGFFDISLAFENGKEYPVCTCHIEAKINKKILPGGNQTAGEAVKTDEDFAIGEQKSEIKFVAPVTGEDGVAIVKLKTPVNPTCGSCEDDFKNQIHSESDISNEWKVSSCTLNKCTWQLVAFWGCEAMADTNIAWANSYGSAEDPYEFLSSKGPSTYEIGVKKKVVADLSCTEGCDGSFVKFEQHLPKPSSAGDLTIDSTKTTQYNKVFYAALEAKPMGLCGDTDSLKTKFYFRIKYDCAKTIEGKDCNDPVQKDSCQKACPTSYCEFDGKSCVNKKEVAPTEVAPTQEAGAAISTMEYNPEYFKKLNPKPDNYVGALPDCAFSGTCRDTNDLVQLIINFGKGMFAILGSFAFAFFVYGGFTIILSMGNAEKVNKGKQILGAAIVGLVVAFCAYLLIEFMLDALQVKDAFKGIK